MNTYKGRQALQYENESEQKQELTERVFHEVLSNDDEEVMHTSNI